jgi:hypothetical protein
MNKVAFLVFLPEKRKNKLSKKNNNYFDYHANAGANIVIELLSIAGIEVDFCSAATAIKYEIVLVSLTSQYDVFAFYKEVALLPDWDRERRKFKVVCGGFGMLNPYPIRHHVDYAVFGRAEDFVVDLVEALLGGGDYEHESVMRLPDISVVKFGQASKLLDLETFKEDAIGCSHKCKFCLYTWTRKLMGASHYVRGGENKNFSPYKHTSGKVSIEVLLKDIKHMKEKYGFTRAGLDGSSQRLRYLYGKRISNEDLIEATDHLGTFEGAKFFKILNVVNFPTETEDDRQEMFEVLKKARPKNMVVVTIHNAPLNPQPCTPLGYGPVTLFPDHSKLKLTRVFEQENLACRYALCETPLSQLKMAIVGRATEETDKLFHTICFSPKLKAAPRDYVRYKMLESNFDLIPYVREYDPDEDKAPGWYLETYLPKSAIKEAYRWTKKMIKETSNGN